MDSNTLQDRAYAWLAVMLLIAIVYGLQAFVLGFLAGRKLGGYVWWILAFLLAPVVSHSLFAFLMYKMVSNEKRQRVGSRILSSKPKSALGIGGTRADEKGVSVTPFNYPSGEQPTKKTPHEQ